MKKIKLMMMALMMCFSLQNCKKQTTSPTPTQQCNCGTISNDGIDNGCYWLEIRNSCTGNKKKFCFDQDVWMNNHVGSNFCVTNQPQW